jgi:aminoglycoside phosphotransferase (APT) family kinase protein
LHEYFARPLTLAGCLPILLRHGLISPSSLVSGQVVVEDTSSRNSNRRVSRQRGAHYLLKQSTGIAQDATVKREAQVYLSLTQIPQFAPNLVRFFCYDPEEDVLILEYLRGMRDLARHYAEGGRISASVSRAMGRVLGRLHRIDAGQLGADVALPSEAPWILSIHRPPLRFLRDVSSGNLELIRVVQATLPFCEKLDEMRTMWEPRAFIHMDVRWSNWLVPDPRTPQRASGIKLLDWETACFGDPRWDVGCALSDNLIWWALQAPETGGEVSRRCVGKDVTRIMHRAIRVFWRQYCAAARVEAAERAHFLYTSLQYAGARLIQSAYERLQRARNLDRFGVSLLQLSANILQHPEAAVERLCGFSRDTA